MLSNRMDVVRNCKNNSGIPPLMGRKKAESLNKSKSGLPWVGGKKRAFVEYAQYFPENIDTLVDLFTGGGTIAFSTPAKKVIANDIDKNMINLYRVLAKDGWERILDYKKSKENFVSAHKKIRDCSELLDTYTRAMYTVADIFMSFHSNRKSYDRLERNNKKTYREFVEKCLTEISNAIRRKDIAFRRGDALELVEELYDNPDIFWFVDPPYLNKSINNNEYYAKMLGDPEQERLAYGLARCRGRVLLCGYRNGGEELYDRHLGRAGFHCYKLYDTKAYVQNTKKGVEKPKRTEYIWSNYVIPGLVEVNITQIKAA